MKFSVIIATFNRASELAKTLKSLADIFCSHEWEVIIVDNNSNDDTATVVADIAKSFPVDLRYIFEGEQGKPAALNTGISVARGAIFVFTDDDHRFEKNWLAEAASGFDIFNCDYVGGKILPLWEATAPSWFSAQSARHRAVIGMADYGSEPLKFGRNPAMGGNMAIRREAFFRVGPWDNRLGRRGKTLLGQEQREWCMRARSTGLTGMYLPEMTVYHVVPAERLQKSYFRRWFYWHGISRAIIYEEFGLDMESPEDSALDFAKVPHIAGVPRYMFRTCWKSFVNTLSAYLNGNTGKGFDQELWLWFFAGILKQRWRNRHKPIPFRRSSNHSPEPIHQ